MNNFRIHYSPEYNLSLLGLEELHPFDTGKAGKALALLRRWMDAAHVDRHVVPVISEASPSTLELAHSRQYLESLTRSVNVAAALEFPALETLPSAMLDHNILRPMRLAVQGTIDAARSAMEVGIAVNLAGGFHHAAHDKGGGFCLYGDVIIALRLLQQEGVLRDDARILYVDLDAHQGDGVCRLCAYYGLDGVKILDMYNKDIFPNDAVAIQRIDFAVPLATGTGDSMYLSLLESTLTQAIKESQPAFIVYNAGTDILVGDPLGNLGVTADGVEARDRYVIDTCLAANIPLLIVPSGGYTEVSHTLIAKLLQHLLNTASGLEIQSR